VAHDFPPHDGRGPFTDAEIARLTLQLDQVITRQRRFAAAWLRSHDEAQPSVPIRPSKVELAVLTALAQTYGPALLTHAEFAPVLEYLAQWGAVVLVQRVLWGERGEDVRLAARLLAARIPFGLLCDTWPKVFMAQAHAKLQGFRPQPPGAFPVDGEGDHD
jgi:hypothetical protein